MPLECNTISRLTRESGIQHPVLWLQNDANGEKLHLGIFPETGKNPRTPNQIVVYNFPAAANELKAYGPTRAL